MGGEENSRPSHKANAALPERSTLYVVHLAEAAHLLNCAEDNTPRLADSDIAAFADIANESVATERRLSHIALRVCLERHVGPEVRKLAFNRSDHGKPYLLNAKTTFNLSHSNRWALIGVATDLPIGVDVIEARKLSFSAERHASIGEAGRAVADGAPLPADPDAATLTAWARIEAVAKATGRGVGQHLSILRGQKSALDMQRPISNDGTDLVARDIDIGNNLFAAVALPRGQPTPPLVKFPATPEALLAFVSGATDSGCKHQSE